MEEYASAPHMATEQFEIVDSELLDELPAPQIDFSDDPRGAVNMRATFVVPMDFEHLWTVVTDPDEFTRVFSRTFKGYDDLAVHEDDGAGQLRGFFLSNFFGFKPVKVFLSSPTQPFFWAFKPVRSSFNYHLAPSIRWALLR